MFNLWSLRVSYIVVCLYDALKFFFVGLQTGSEFQNLIIQHMDISEPLTTLKHLLEQRLATNLAQHDFYLQDVIPVSTPLNDICRTNGEIIQLRRDHFAVYLVVIATCGLCLLWFSWIRQRT